LKVKRVIINKLKDDTYFAKLVLASHDKSYEIDCRPSDALDLPPQRIPLTELELPVF